MRVLIESGYLWLGSTSFEVKFETTVAELAEMFFQKEERELERFVFNRKLYPDEFPEASLREMHATLEDCGMVHGSTLHAIINQDQPLPKLKVTTNEHIRDRDKEAAYIALGRQAVITEKALTARRDEAEMARALPRGWCRHKGDKTTRKPGVWYYEHEDGTRQWKYPSEEQTREMEAVNELKAMSVKEVEAIAIEMGLEYKDCIVKQQMIERIRARVKEQARAANKASGAQEPAPEIAEAN